MNRITTAILVICAFAAPLRGADVNPVEAKLREGLKTTMLQLRTVQSEKAVIEAAKLELDAQVAALTEKLAATEKQFAEEKAAAEKRIAEQTERLVERGNAMMKVEGELALAQKAHKEASALAAKKEAERAKVNSEKIVLERKVAEQQVKNTKMFEIGSEILARYERFGLGTAIAAREPFVGLTRVKLKNQFQELGDKLEDQKIKP